MTRREANPFLLWQGPNFFLCITRAKEQRRRQQRHHPYKCGESAGQITSFVSRSIIVGLTVDDTADQEAEQVATDIVDAPREGY